MTTLILTNRNQGRLDCRFLAQNRFLSAHKRHTTYPGLSLFSFRCYFCRGSKLALTSRYTIKTASPQTTHFFQLHSIDFFATQYLFSSFSSLVPGGFLSFGTLHLLLPAVTSWHYSCCLLLCFYASPSQPTQTGWCYFLNDTPEGRPTEIKNHKFRSSLSVVRPLGFLPDILLPFLSLLFQLR